MQCPEFDSFLLRLSFDYSVNVDARQVHGIWVKSTSWNDFFDFGNTDFACNRDIGVEVASRLPPNEVTRSVRLPCLDEGKVARD